MPPPIVGALTIGTKILGGFIKGSFTPMDLTQEPYRGQVAAVATIKNERGVRHFSDYGVSIVVRYINGNFPSPDRDSKDTANRLQAEFYYSEAVRLAKLPINGGGGRENIDLSQPGSSTILGQPPVQMPGDGIKSFSTLPGSGISSASMGGIGVMPVLIAGLAVGVILLVRQ